MAQYIYTMNGVGKVVPPKKHILRDIYLSFYPGAKIGVLGYNGAGKSTLLRIMAGIDKEIEGEARPMPGINIGYLPQEPQLDESKDVRGNVMEGLGDIAEKLARFNEISEAFADPDADFDALLTEQAELQEAIDAADGWEINNTLDRAGEALNLPPWDADVSKLSGGERRRVALCRLLLSKPDMLLLDEPTNHLDAESVAWLERTLQDYAGTVVAVTHDRYFLDNVAGWILELDHGRGYPFEGNYSGFLEQKEARIAQEKRDDDKRNRTLKRELEWVRMAPKARQSKGKARLAAYDKLLEESKAAEGRAEELSIVIPANKRLGDVVIEASNISKAFGDKLLIDDFSFTLPPAGIVGVIGANGAGKSTLFKMLIDEYEDTNDPVAAPDSGTIQLGGTVQLGYVDQNRTLDPEKTVYDEITGGVDHLEVGGREMHGRSYVASFNFKGPDQQKLVSNLSGGERNRVHLAKVLKEGANVLLLDEPTNDLDIDTLRALEDAIEAYAGCAVIVSHDRWFLDRVATHIVAFEGESQVRWFEGNFTDYAEYRKREHGVDAMRPHRIKYKPVTRG
jgi:ATP-binding cassette ChvD family protein